MSISGKYKFPQTATIWKQTGLDMRGNALYGTPVKTHVRWEDTETVFIGSDGRESRGTAIVYLPDDLASVGDFISYGDSSSATPNSEAQQVKALRRVTNMSGSRTEYRVVL